MGATDGKLLLDGAAWASNVLTSVCIIFINKVLMAKKGGYGFQFGEHYLCCCTLHSWSAEIGHGSVS